MRWGGKDFSKVKGGVAEGRGSGGRTWEEGGVTTEGEKSPQKKLCKKNKFGNRL